MNYFKSLLGRSIDKQQEPQKSSKQYELSGQFQIIQPDDIENQKNNQKQINLEDIQKQYITKQQYESQLNKHNNSLRQEDSLQMVISQSQGHQDKQQTQLQCQTIVKKYNVIESFDSQQISVNASTVKIDDYFMLVDNKDLQKKFQSQSQWNKFYQKIQKDCQKQNKKSLSITFEQLNSIISLQTNDQHRREQYWSEMTKCNINLKQSKLLTSSKDKKKMQANLQKISLNIEVLLQNKQHIEGHLKLPQIKQCSVQGYQKAQTIKNQLQSTKTMILQMLTLYGGNDAQIGYSKGLQYVALGIILSQPKCTETKLKSSFKYLMFKKQLRNMYFPGTPKLYEQISLLEQCMQSQVPRIKERLQQIDGDLMKLFIGYYKTFLIYKLENCEIIRKIFQLLLIYGIDLVRIILIRILCKKQQFILSIQNPQKLMQYLAQNLISDYFKMDSEETPNYNEQQTANSKQTKKQEVCQYSELKVIQKLKSLFITKDLA